MVERGCSLGEGEAAFIQAMEGPKKCKKGCRCGKTGGQKLCDHILLEYLNINGGVT